MYDKKKRVCPNCEWYGKHDGIEVCRFNPPMITKPGGYIGEFPTVMKDDWCSKWMERRNGR